MRIGVVAPVAAYASRGTSLAGEAAAIEEAGLDLIWLAGAGKLPADTLAAAALIAASTSVLRIASAVAIGPHPVHLAEEALVADNVSNGRLVLALDAGASGDALGESADVVIAAAAPRPFRHRGLRWNVPGALPGNRSEHRLAVTPQPAGLELPIWLAGHGAPAAARERCLSHVTAVSDGPDDASRAWELTQHALGAAARRLRRPAIRTIETARNGDFNDGALRERLYSESDRWGLDVALLALPPGLERHARASAIARIGSLVRPALQMDRLPSHLQEHLEGKLRERFPLP